MGKKEEKVSRDVNGIQVEQRISDGFINATAMCVAHEKDANDWFTTQDTFDLFLALAQDLGIEVKTGEIRDLDISRLSATKYVKMFPGLVLSKRGSPATDGGTWLHPDLAIQIAQWCSKPFAIQVSRWVCEWMTTGQNPVYTQEVDQLKADGFINGTAMCSAYNKNIVDWFRTTRTFNLFCSLASDLGIKSNMVLHHDSDISRLSHQQLSLFGNDQAV